MPQRLLGEGPTPVAKRDPRLYLDVQTEPLEMMGGSGLVSVPTSVPMSLTSTMISPNIVKVDIDAPSSPTLQKDDFSNISHGVL